jgi:integrase
MTTVGELYDRYRPLILSNISPGTGRAYTYAWGKRVGPTFGARHIEQISTLEVELAVASWPGAYSTRVDALSLLSRICRTAIKGGIIPTNPCVGVERPRTQDSDPTSRALNLEQIDLLLDALPQAGPYRRFVLAMLYTGCRLGEIAALRPADIDWATNTINISRTASPGLTGQLMIGPTKGRRVRAVPLAAPFAPVVREAAEGKEPFSWLFPGPRGGTINSKNLSRALDWFNIRESIKRFPPDEEQLHWHDLRHTAAVMLFRAGLSAPDVQAILGHSSLAVTQLYANTRNDAAKRGAVALSDFYGPKSRGQLEGGEEAAKTGSDLDI